MSTKPSGTPSSGRDRAARIGAAVLCLVGLLAFGFAAGGFLGGRVFGRGSVGWDALADALGGAALGLGAAVVAFVAIVGRLDTRRLAWTGGAGVAAGALIILVLQISRP